MKPFLVALAAGLIATAMPISRAGAADPPVVVAVPAATAPITTAPTATAPSGDSWRFKFYNGYWWYWTPDNRWLCYMNGQWVVPGTPVQTGAVAYPYQVVPQPYYYPYPYGYYPNSYYGGGIYFGGGYGGYWHGGYGGYGGHHR